MLLSLKNYLNSLLIEETVAIFFATKATYLSYLFWGAWVSFFILIAALTCLFFRRMETVCIITAMILLVKIIETFPYTINHFMFEFLISIMLFLWFLEKLDHKDPQIAISQESWVIRYGKFFFLSVWVYAGIQKLVQGEYLNGQFFFFTFANSSDQTERLVDFVNSFLSTELLLLTSSYADANFATQGLKIESFPNLWNLSIAIGWSVTLSEIVLPIWVVCARSKLVPCLVWYATQLTIGFFSKEIDFMWSCLLMQGLFVSAPYRRPILTFTLLSMVIFHCIARFVS